MSSIILHWEQDIHNLIYFEFSEFWKIDDLLSSIDKSRQIFRDTDGVIDVVADMLQVTSTPINLVKLKNYLCSLDNRRIGLVVIVTRNRHLRSVGKLLCQLMRSHFNFQFVDSMDQAYQVLQRTAATRSAQFSG